MLGHQRAVPIGGPALVHDLGHGLRGVVVALFADDAEAVGLPILEPGVLEQVEQDVARGPGGRDVPHLRLVVLELLGFRGQALRRVDPPVHVVLSLIPRRLLLLALLGLLGGLHRSPAHEHAVRVDQVLERKADVQKLLHRVVPLLLNVLADVGGVVRHLVHHLAVGLAEPQVVLEEIAVPVDVRDHQLLVDNLVGLLKVGVTGVVVDDHLVDSAQAVVMALAEALVLGTKPPVGIARGEPAIRGDLVHLLVIAHLENDREEVQAVATGALADLLLGGQQFRGEGGEGVGSHKVLVFRQFYARRSRIPQVVIARCGMRNRACSRRNCESAAEPDDLPETGLAHGFRASMVSRNVSRSGLTLNRCTCQASASR